MIPLHLAALIPGCEAGSAPKAVQVLPGGRGCNLVLRVDTDAGSFVLRQRQPPLDRPGSAAMTELRCQLAAAAAGIAPRIIHAAMDGSWLLMDYIDAKPWTCEQLLSDQGVEQLGLRLAQLHCLPVPRGVPLFDAVEIAAGYLQQLQDQDPPLAATCQPVLRRIQELSHALREHELPVVLNHGDLQSGNMLGSGPMLVDWEYAQLVDATYDIACLLTYYPGLESRREQLVQCAGLDGGAYLAALAVQRERFACLNQLWSRVNDAKAG
ncbi:MAG: aminoglycoside phosphotransferase family protein [Pseudomonadota bacterium]